ncbi:MAG: putative esterase [uncultured Rubrobacteraceae bacterium]|uniref:Putative esterase n=1 Tax=uncultured Rubrobacteraceae bacterium TaxID=349277 RepID=A0A6J4QUX8_9ACTN|nr:MAG: putative esterase [uncultured Rubrobacteraceae bacterium]
MNDLQRQVQEAIDDLVESGAERGLQVAVYRDGEPVVDAVAGVADPATGRPVGSDTPFYAYSTGKGATAAVAHVLVERGLFGYDTPVVGLWPEFGAHGKEAATVRHVLTHTVGVPGVPADTTPEDLCDWEKMCAVIAAAEPWWEPGTGTAYHAYTFGYIVGELVRRATGTPISQVLREEVAAPLGIADELYFGVPEPELGRLARLEDQEGAAEFLASIPDDSPFLKWGPRATVPTAGFGNRPDVLMADIPAGGKMSARAMARMYAGLLGEVGGVRLLSPARLREVSAVAYSGVDEIMGNPVTWALGFPVGQIGSNAQQTPTAFGWGGVGGSYAGADTATGTTFALTKNRLSPDFGAAEHIAGIVKKFFAES